jgi:hypothetical protein
MDRKEPRIIVLSAMHHRQETVKYCLDKMPFVEKIMIYSTKEDGDFLKSQDVIYSEQTANNPISTKWNTAVESLSIFQFDAVILLGSDDWIDTKFLDFVTSRIGTFDLLAFKDIYFEKGSDRYYWEGYTNHRKGEPCGAGKVYSREFLEKINFNLFPKSKDYSLDGMSWEVVQKNNANIVIESLKENGLMLCDVKDGEGLTKLHNIQGIVKL